jgi:hypothetical protein
MILIGSRAIKHWFSDFREPKDWDYICNEKYSNLKNLEKDLEIHIIPKIFDNYKEDTLNPNDLYTLKCSHIFWNIKWQKHIYDIQFLQNKGCTLNEKLFWKLYNYWIEIHGKRKEPDFNKTTEEFFQDKVKREYNHDELHLNFMYYDFPLYQKVLINPNSVEPSQELFNQLSFEDKIKLVDEECYVIGYERWSNELPKVAYYRALKVMIQRLAPIWLAKFIIENYNSFKPHNQYKEIWKNLTHLRK